MPTDGRAPEDPAVVGRVVKPHGLHGEVVVEAEDPGSTHLDPGAELWVGGRWRPVVSSKIQGERRIIGLDGVADRDAAEALRGAEMAVAAADLTVLDGRRYYVHDLVGCRVEDTAGVDLGEVVAVVVGPQDQLEVEHADGRSLVPMVEAMLKEVDVDRRRIVIDPPDGLVEATKA